jgi:1-deoxyxylulose-5-phosphate synthase
MSLEKRRLGKSHIQVSRLDLGCVTFGREIDEATSIQLMSAALDLDINPIDTAEAYGGDQARQYRHNVLEWMTHVKFPPKCALRKRSSDDD